MSPGAQRPRRAQHSARTLSPARQDAPPRLELHLLGGFSVVAAGVAVEGFESRKVRAVLAYLALQGSHAVARERLAAIFWPDLEPAGARRNLRQTIYNLRAALGRAERCMIANPHEVRLDLTGVAVDALLFEKAAREGLAGHGPASVAALARVLELYRGEFLAGLRVGAAEQYEEWRASERTRLRELAMEAARAALRRSEGDGLHETALRFARRLGELEPLSEEACRSRMRLLGRLGRRVQALAEASEFAGLLQRELGVEMGEETRSLQAAILADDELPTPDVGASGPSGPLVPLVGRERAWRQLTAVWGEVRHGKPHLTLILGGRGTGKSRLIRSFVHEALGGSAGAVLLARCHEGAGSSLRATLAEAVASLPLEVTEQAWPAIAAAVAALPEVAERRRDLPGLVGTPGGRRATPLAPPRALAALLVRLTRPPRSSLPDRGSPVVLFVDDLELSPAVLAGLIEIRQAVDMAPVWIVAAARSDELAAETVGALRSAVEEAGGGSIALAALDREDVLRAARDLVGDPGAQELAAALFAASQGLPLALAEAVNLLADEGRLRRGERGRWSITAAEALAGALPRGLEPLIHRRMALLPKTSRRLLGLAAVAGEHFDTATLLEVDQEHPTVLEAALEILVARWMVRPLLRSWAVHRRDRDLAIWNAGARRGPFEFAQRVVRDLLCEAMDPARRRVLHRAIATAIAHQDDGSRHDELARHWLLAGELAPAVESLAAAARRLRGLGDDQGAAARLREARGILTRLRHREGSEPGDANRLAAVLEKLASKDRPSRRSAGSR